MSADREKGVYRKYDVVRTDGGSEPGKKHHRCAYFVLDLTHDRFAIPALKAYAKVCKKDFPELARDLMVAVNAKPCNCREANCHHFGPQSAAGAIDRKLLIDDMAKGKR